MTNDEQAAIIKKAAKGSNQERLVEQLMNGGMPCACANLRGKARSFATKYELSQQAMIERIKATGVKLEFHAGPRGGRHSGYWTVADAGARQ